MMFKSFSIWLYMMKYDVYHRKMMFKVISITTKPCKHPKYNEIWRNTLKKNQNVKKLGIFDFYPKFWFAPKLIICMHVFLDVPDSKKNSKPLNIIKIYMFLIISLLCFGHFYDFLQQNWNCHIFDNFWHASCPVGVRASHRLFACLFNKQNGPFAGALAHESPQKNNW